MGAGFYFTKPQNLQWLHEGPLGGYIDAFADRLRAEGHCRQSGWRNLRVGGDFSHWLQHNGFGTADVDERIVKRYERFRARHRHPFLSDHPALSRLLSVLREVGAIAPRRSDVLGAAEQIENDFKRYLIQERGLAGVSVARHELVLRQFLCEHCHGKHSRLRQLKPSDVMRFVEHYAKNHGARCGQMMCWTLRSFLRYLRYCGETEIDLASAVPTIRRWKLASLPEYASPSEIDRVLSTCERRSSIGRRNYAMLLLLARLGLRANEIRLLTLDDIDWQSGQLQIHGKGGRSGSMPLPVDVGAAISEYLQYGRPPSASRRVFLRDLAPHEGFATSGTVSFVAAQALKRTGIAGVAHKGSHLFRHSLATQLLRGGASLTEIGQVLRHRRYDSTRLYAKVDVDSLSGLALPWPGVMP